MALAQLDTIRKVFDRVREADRGDGELLARYRQQRDPDAFGSLVRRHGPMVLGVCRRVLRDSHAADDAFQATFLVLARKADAVRPPDRLAPWLYGVAYRTALKARGRTFRRQQVEHAYAVEVSNRPPAPAEVADLLPVIDEQLNALPEKYRVPLVLCALQGLNKAEAAERLGLPEGTVSSRLARAREMLRDRLTRRGVVVPAAALGVLFTADALRAAVPPALAASAAEVAVGSAIVSPTVLALSNEVLRSMTFFQLKTLCAVATVIALTGGFGLYAISADEKKPVPQGEKPAVQPGEKPAGEKPPAGKKPTGLADEVVKMEVQRHFDAQGKASKGTATIEDKEKIGQLLALFPEVGTDKKPDAGGPAGYSAGYSLILHRKKGDPIHLVISHNRKFWFWGTTGTDGDWNLKDPKKVDAFLDGLLTAAKPDGEKPAKPAKPDGEKPRVAKSGGKVASVDAKELTLMIAAKGDNGIVERMFKVAPDAKVFIDGKEAKLADVPKNSTAALVLAPGKEGALPTATEVRVTGSAVTGVVAKVDRTGLTLDGEKAQRVVKLAQAGKVTVNGKDAALTDIKVGDKVAITLTADESGALTIATGTKAGDGEKPGVKNPKFGGKVTSLDPSARTVTLVGKGEGGKEIVVKLTADAKITVDGKSAAIADIKKGVFATFTLVAAKDGQPREANEVTVAGTTFAGVIKQADTNSITIGNEKSDRVVKLAAGGKVLVGEKEVRLADLKVGDKVTVTLTSDESAATLIQGGVKKPTGDKPKPEKEEDE